MELLFASGNAHKIQEINNLIHNKKLRIKGLKEIGYFEEIPETGKTLEENARIKARHIYKLFGKPVFSEDTGLEIIALNNRPGVHTARYASKLKDPNLNMTKVLKELIGKENRSARFRAVIALILDGEEFLFEGIINGEINTLQKGSGGFGYDPIFTPIGYDKTFGELPEIIKNNLSHRAVAFNKMMSFLGEKNYI